ncbi:hypothetical protein OMW55_10040 [Sphingomonas sp. BN140010]|uniref:17 kDa surface antigen n=1 Tax=Sphingomonas arvum TaxID=2992113 RepID=A0ABT3JGC9_9SPHN|nr:hypothetical protein [Sphingomonas sp. BN140010]MCW3798143.1 hypothetical protein [Sphingomonas sp. BN140010]
MRPINRIIAATALATTAVSSMAVPAEARTRHSRSYYSGRTAYAYKYCRRSPGTTGLLVGGVGGALLGRKLIGHGLLGTAGGVVGGALAGRAIDRTISAQHRCRYR